MMIKDMASSSRIFCGSLLLSSFLVVCMFLIAFAGLVHDGKLYTGNNHYAEILRFPWCDIMPLNTLINVGYIAVGVYWFVITNKFFARGILKSWDCYFFYTFNNLALLYGIVSIFRMTTQMTVWAVIDRWLTLPIFSVVPLWSSHIRDECSPRLCRIVMSLSIFSYFYTLIIPDFYEILVAIHILRAVHGGCMAYHKHRTPDSLYYFFGALCSCCLFVLGSLFDRNLPAYSPLFHYISGHFISRAFDAAQIHFTNSFFFDMTMQKVANEVGQEKSKLIKENLVLPKNDGEIVSEKHHNGDVVVSESSTKSKDI